MRWGGVLPFAVITRVHMPDLVFKFLRKGNLDEFIDLMTCAGKNWI
jgi:hypothetical protein